MKCTIVMHCIWVFTVYYSTASEVSSIGGCDRDLNNIYFAAAWKLLK